MEENKEDNLKEIFKNDLFLSKGDDTDPFIKEIRDAYGFINVKLARFNHFYNLNFVSKSIENNLKISENKLCLKELFYTQNPADIIINKNISEFHSKFIFDQSKEISKDIVEMFKSIESKKNAFVNKNLTPDDLKVLIEKDTNRDILMETLISIQTKIKGMNERKLDDVAIKINFVSLIENISNIFEKLY